MTYNGIELTAEDILRIALIEPTDTPEEKAAIEITPLVRKLKRLNAKIETLREKRDCTPNPNPWFPSHAWRAATKELTEASGDAMHLESQIIAAHLAQLP